MIGLDIPFVKKLNLIQKTCNGMTFFDEVQIFVTMCIAAKEEGEEAQGENCRAFAFVTTLSLSLGSSDSALNEWNIEPDDARHFSFTFFADKNVRKLSIIFQYENYKISHKKMPYYLQNQSILKNSNKTIQCGET